MKILSNKEYDKLINDKTPTIKYYMNNPYQARKIKKLEDYNIELEIKIEKKDKEIERLNNVIKEVREYIKDIQNTMWHDDKEVLKTILEILDKRENKINEVMSVEELESYEPKNIAEQEYQDWFWD